MLTIAAETDADRRAERIAVLHGHLALPPVVSNADCRMDRPLFDCLGSGGEHAYRQLEIAIDHVPQGPVAWGLVLEIPGSSRKAEHRQDAAVREALAESFLHEAGVHGSLSNLRNKGRGYPPSRGCSSGADASEARSNKERITNLLDHARVAIDPFLNDVSHADASIAGRRIGRRLAPRVRSPEFTMDAIAAAVLKQVQIEERPAENLFRQDPLKDLRSRGVDVGGRWRISGDLFWALEIVVVVTAATAERERE